jgi:ribosomal protein L35AE/L33A
MAKRKQHREKKGSGSPRAPVSPPPVSRGSAAGRGAAYDSFREGQARRDRDRSKSGRDIGEIPAVVNRKRREDCRHNFRLYCETYHSATFCLAWSPDHLKVIAAVEGAVLRGELVVYAMPRGSGKTSLEEVAAEWAMNFGHRSFVAIIGSTEDHAAGMLDSIKTEYETNDLLLEDFPEIVHPIAKLERINNRARGQTYRGKPTHITWKDREIRLPTIPGSPASGGIIRVAGITGAVRGMKAKRPGDGQTIRPSLVLIDDPQTDDSARSPKQVADRERVLKGAILGLAGPNVRIAGLATVTVVAPDDLAERLLDRKRHPAWQGQRMKLVYAWPTRVELWEQYAELRRKGQRDGTGTGDADAFYLANREAMDEGAEVAWPERKHDDERSAIQHAWNIRIDRGESAFHAEYQNEPIPETQIEASDMSAPEISEKTNGKKRGAIPLGCQRLTMFTDCQGEALYWMVCAWEENFTGYVVDYGCFPDQRRSYFTLREITKRLSDVTKAKSAEGRLMEGLRMLHDEQLRREWTREDGSVMNIERAIVDAGYLPDAVFQFCHESGRSGVVMPSRGYGVKASQTPFSMYSKKPGDMVGHYWRVPTTARKRIIRHVEMDVNYWKSFVHARLAVPRGDAGCLSLFGDRPEFHRMLADHLTAEVRVTNTAKGRTVDEWKERPGKPDNHWFDCLVGCAVGASMLGSKLSGGQGYSPKARKPVRWSDRIRQRKGG